jgi:hypothetical protein
MRFTLEPRHAHGPMIERIRFEVSDAIATIRLNRPERLAVRSGSLSDRRQHPRRRDHRNRRSVNNGGDVDGFPDSVVAKTAAGVKAGFG